MNRLSTSNRNYQEWADDIKSQIRTAQMVTAIKVNTDLLQLYWNIGKKIIEVQSTTAWGTTMQVIDELSKDLIKEFPDAMGYSGRNLRYMRSFAEAYPDFPNLQVPLAKSGKADGPRFWQVPLAEIPWYHHITLLSKVKDPMERAFYIAQAAENGWSRDVMLRQIESNLYERGGKAINNFPVTLPAPQSDLARDIFKDPYRFGFLSIAGKVSEHSIEQQLTQRITEFLLELGRGFAFVGRQHPVEVDGDDYFIDLLFYHTKLHAYVAVELKAGEFRPEFVGKLNFYLSAVDSALRGPGDNPTIGLLLCASKSNIKAEYALRGMTQPLGVASYELGQALPEEIRSELPSVEDIESELEK